MTRAGNGQYTRHPTGERPTEGRRGRRMRGGSGYCYGLERSACSPSQRARRRARGAGARAAHARPRPRRRRRRSRCTCTQPQSGAIRPTSGVSSGCDQIAILEFGNAPSGRHRRRHHGRHQGHSVVLDGEALAALVFLRHRRRRPRVLKAVGDLSQMKGSSSGTVSRRG